MRFGAVWLGPLAVLYGWLFASAVCCVERRLLRGVRGAVRCVQCCAAYGAVCCGMYHVPCGVLFRMLVGVRGHARWCASCRSPRRVTRLSALCSCAHVQAMRRAHRLDGLGVCDDACCVLCAVPCHAVPRDAVSRPVRHVLCCVLYVRDLRCCAWALCFVSCAVAWAVL